jgi:hypothetical protein
VKEVLPMASQSFLRRTAPVWLAVLSISTAWSCGEGRDGEPVAATGPIQVSGRYEVSGTTTDPGRDQKRRIAGTIVVVQDGDGYTSSYELQTTWPSEDGSTSAHVLGFGRGTIEGDRLEGTTHTQLVISTVPGVDAGFAYVPSSVTKVLVSDSVSTIAPDGSITIDLQNRGVEGEDYRPTRTRMTGRRVADYPAP